MAETDVINQVIEDVGDIKTDIRQMDGRLSRLEDGMNVLRENVAHVTGTTDQLSQRVSNLEQTMRQMQGDLSTAQRWIIGIILGTWLTTILTILLKIG